MELAIAELNGSLPAPIRLLCVCCDTVATRRGRGIRAVPVGMYFREGRPLTFLFLFFLLLEATEGKGRYQGVKRHTSSAQRTLLLLELGTFGTENREINTNLRQWAQKPFLNGE